jgi:hypothetical protein
MCHALKDTDVDFRQFYDGRWTKGPSLFLTLSEVPFTMQIKTEVNVCKVVKPPGGGGGGGGCVNKHLTLKFMYFTEAKSSKNVNNFSQ